MGNHTLRMATATFRTLAVLFLALILGACTQPVEYVGHVIDADTLARIDNAEISLEFEGAPPIVYTDSAGVFRFTVNSPDKNITCKIRVEAVRYAIYDRYITLDADNPKIEDIRLSPLGNPGPTPDSSITPSPEPTATPIPVNIPARTSTPRPSATPAPQIASEVDMALVPIGEYMMGNQGAKADGDADELAHLVKLNAFYIDVYEVTNARYAGCVQAGGCKPPTQTRDYNKPQYADYPVVYVTWDQAKTYCAWRGGRLPTEAEWETAARGGQEGRRFPWGDDKPSCSPGAPNGANYKMCSEPFGLWAVGRFEANGYGLYDMAGNAWEWVNDWYDSESYNEHHVLNPSGPANGSYRVMRGGSWGSAETTLRTASRGSENPDVANNIIGFRCARSANTGEDIANWPVYSKIISENAVIRMAPSLEAESGRKLEVGEQVEVIGRVAGMQPAWFRIRCRCDQTEGWVNRAWLDTTVFDLSQIPVVEGLSGSTLSFSNQITGFAASDLTLGLFPGVFFSPFLKELIP